MTYVKPSILKWAFIRFASRETATNAHKRMAEVRNRIQPRELLRSGEEYDYIIMGKNDKSTTE